MSSKNTTVASDAEARDATPPRSARRAGGIAEHPPDETEPERAKRGTPRAEQTTELAEHRTELSQARTELSQARTELAEKQTNLAEVQTALANQRTVLSWIRTSIAAVAAGAGFMLVFTSPTLRGPSLLLGETLLGLAALISIAGLWEYFSLSRRLPDSDVPHASDTLIVLLGLTVVVAAIAAGVMLALR